MKNRNLGIGFATGRRNFKRVLLSYLRTWEAADKAWKERSGIRIHLFVSYDLEYRDTKSTDYTNLPQEIVDLFDSITFVGEKNTLRSLESIRKNKKYRQEELESVFGSGYAAKRNEVLFAAIESKMDYLLFLDDDEYPMAVTKNNEYCLWSGQQVIASHLRVIERADYTHGFHCGYISPIPQVQFNDILSEKTFRSFIEAISNDIISWNEMKKLIDSGGVTYASTDVLAKQAPQEVPLVSGCKFISGANLCINLTDPYRTFPFFNPPAARGEDTFLSTLLQERTVIKVPCYTFHDGFSVYQNLLEGALPIKLKPVMIGADNITERFLNACIGWIRYKPLLIFITDPEHFDEKMEDIGQKLGVTLPFVAAYFSDERFLDIETEFVKYRDQAKNHYALFEVAQKTWARILLEIT